MPARLLRNYHTMRQLHFKYTHLASTAFDAEREYLASARATMCYVQKFDLGPGPGVHALVSHHVQRTILLFLSFLLLIGYAPGLRAAGAPRPPCGVTPAPDYPPLAAAPAIRLWHPHDLPDGWHPPQCIAWASADFSFMVGVAARFRGPPNTNALLARIGAISSMTSVKYWSVNRKDWERLFKRATAIVGPKAKQPRPDFTASELRDGRSHYFLEEDNRSGDIVVTRLVVTHADRDHIIFETVNVTPVKLLFVTLYSPGELHAIYFLTRQVGNLWNYYSLSWVGPGPPLLTAFVRRGSYINRADALFRHLAGIPTDRAPPARP